MYSDKKKTLKYLGLYARNIEKNYQRRGSGLTMGDFESPDVNGFHLEYGLSREQKLSLGMERKRTQKNSGRMHRPK